MPAAVSPIAQNGVAAPDDLDNLLDYDGAVQDFWKDLPEAGNGIAQDASNETSKDIDEEVRVTKKRKPNPKLDDTRLLSDAGIPKLRRITKDRLKFRGKGHEFADMSRMLNLYQLWLDDLYPKAKFRDALTMVEKLGHSKRMQVSRRAWIDETKASQRRNDEEDKEPQAGPADKQAGDGDLGSRPGADVGGENHGSQDPVDQVPGDDDLDALFAEEASAAQTRPRDTMPERRGPFDDDDEEDEPGEDELDALLAEDRTRTNEMVASAPSRHGPFQESQDSDQDELDALLADEPMGQATISSGTAAKSTPHPAIRADNDFADEEEAMRDMDW